MAGFDMGSAIQQIMGAANSDDDFLASLQADPIAAIEKAAGIDIPSDQIEGVLSQMGGVEGIMSQLGGGNDAAKGIEDAIGGLVGGLFGSK